MNNYLETYFNDFNELFDVDRVKKLLTSTYEKKEYIDVPEGTYICSIDAMEVTVSKSSNSPMLKVIFNIEEGNLVGSKMYMYQLIHKPDGQYDATDFVKSLGTNQRIIFGSIDIFKVVAKKVFEATIGKLEYDVKLTKSKNGFNCYKITQIYDLV